jgi:predicted DNA-binding protein
MTRVDDDQDVEAVGKYQRSIRLTKDMATRLHAVCDHLGVTVGAYLTQAIGESVARHEVSLLAKQSKDNSMEVLTRFFEAMAQEAGTDDKPKRSRAAKAK